MYHVFWTETGETEALFGTAREANEFLLFCRDAGIVGLAWSAGVYVPGL